jgi:predicted phage gp36 major capsid-like protein
VDRLGATMSYIPHLFSTTTGRPTGQGGWYTYWRGGADVVVTNALRLLKL